MEISVLHHWWIYPLAAYYLTWLITYQILLHQYICCNDGVFGRIYNHIRFCLRALQKKNETIGDVFISLLIVVWIIICGVFCIFWWIISVLYGFVPILNNITSSFKILEHTETKNNYYAFEPADYKKVFIIRMWIFVFEQSFYGIEWLMNLRIRKTSHN